MFSNVFLLCLYKFNARVQLLLREVERNELKREFPKKFAKEPNSSWSRKMHVIQSHKMCSSLSPLMGKHTRKNKVLSVAEIYHLRNLSPSMTAAITQEDI